MAQRLQHTRASKSLGNAIKQVFVHALNRAQCCATHICTMCLLQYDPAHQYSDDTKHKHKKCPFCYHEEFQVALGEPSKAAAEATAEPAPESTKTLTPKTAVPEEAVVPPGMPEPSAPPLVVLDPVYHEMARSVVQTAQRVVGECMRQIRHIRKKTATTTTTNAAAVHPVHPARVSPLLGIVLQSGLVQLDTSWQERLDELSKFSHFLDGLLGNKELALDPELDRCIILFQTILSCSTELPERIVSPEFQATLDELAAARKDALEKQRAKD